MPRKLILLVLFSLAVSITLLCQTQSALDLEKSLGFEVPPVGTIPGGWNAYPSDMVFADDHVVRSGKYAVRIERNASSPFSTVTMMLPIDFKGKEIELRGYLRTEDVGEFAGLWMREDGDSPSLAFDNMRSRQVKGTTPWTGYSIKLPLHPGAKSLYFGALVAGMGRAWADDLHLFVDGQPIWDAPKFTREKTVLETDTEFNTGSRIAVSQLSKTQIENLVTLGKVWGFLKYHHPAVTSGKYQWDYQLFRVLPSVLAANDSASSNNAILKWIDALGPISPCNPCAKLNSSRLYFGPELRWIHDEETLGPELSRRLQFIYTNRPTGSQFYVALVPQNQNPRFEHELPYTSFKFPDFGFQLLAVYRFWNSVEYWSPDRDVIGEDWNAVLARSIPSVALARDEDSYTLQLFTLTASLHDGHASLWTKLGLRPPVGKCQLPASIRYIENQPVIVSVASGVPTDLTIGDVLTEFDGVPVAQLVKTWLPFYSASNDAARMRDIGKYISRGACAPATVKVRRDNQDLQLSVARVALPQSIPGSQTHDLPGDTFHLLSKDIAYLKLSTVKSADAIKYIEQSAGTKGLIIDIRNYPSEFVVFDLGSHLIKERTPFALFTFADLENPGAFVWGDAESITPAEPHYSGKVVILVDEVTMSSAEYTSMAFRAVPGAIVVGSTTSGADGDVSGITLPGGIPTIISGLGVFYPNRKPTQRVGILPDIVSTPTIVGMKEGRDEVLEEAVRQILGDSTPPEVVKKIAR